MQDHVKPTIRDINPQQIILHVGTNDLKTERTASQIAKSVIDLSISSKKNRNMIAVSGIVPKLDELNNKAALRITYKDKFSAFQELLEKDNSVSIHHRNIQKLAMEIYKVLHGFSPPILNDIFVPVSGPYNFRRNDTLQRRRVNSVRHSTKSVSFLGPKI